MKAAILTDLRDELDIVDEELIKTLGKRINICRRVAIRKREYGIPMMQPERIKLVKERVILLANAYDIDPDLVSAIYDKIIQAACNLETELIAG